MLRKIIHFSIHHKIFILLGVVLVLAWGIWSAINLPLDALPDITNNQVQIITQCPSYASAEVEQLITSPIEKSLSNIPDLTQTRSISRFGLSVITVVFKEKTDIYFARQLISEKINGIKDDLPSGIELPQMAPISTGLGEIYQYVLRAKKGSESKYNATDLRTMQDWIVARQLYGIEGVAEVNSFGGKVKEYEIRFKPDQLNAFHVSTADICRALANNNENIGGAYIEKKSRIYYIRGTGQVKSMEDLGNIPVRKTGIPVYIKDVAEIKIGSAIRYGGLTYNGTGESVGGIVMMLKGHNSLKVVSLVKERIQEIQKSLPADVVIEPYLDRTDLIHRAIHTVEKNLLEGALIVIFILVLFLGNIRAGIIVASVIPLSMLFALSLMKLFNVSANLMSLGAIDFGLIVDGSVIIVEATLHYLKHQKIIPGHKLRYTPEEMNQAVEGSTYRMMRSALFGQLIILIVYIPILALRGVEGKMFIPMAQTVSFALIGAMILSLTYVPALSSILLSRSVNNKQDFSEKFIHYLRKKYERILHHSLRLKWGILGTTLLLLLFSFFQFSRMGSEFIPTLEEGDYTFDFLMPQGTSLSQTLQTSLIAERIVRRFPEVKKVIGKTGSAEIPTDPMPIEGTDLIIILKDKKEWKTTKDYMQLADCMIADLKQIPGAYVEYNQPIQMKFNDLLSGVKQDIAVKIFGENMDTLLKYGQKVADIIQTIPGAKPPAIERVSGLPQITIEYDRQKLSYYGLDIKEMNELINTTFAGQKVGVLYEDEKKFDIVVRMDEIYKNDIARLENFPVIIKDHSIPLGQVANILVSQGPSQISRESGKRRIVVGYNIKDKDIKGSVNLLKKELDRSIKLPPGYYYQFGGTFENLKEATKRLNTAVPISLILILIILYFTFRAVGPGLLIFTTIPMSTIGGIMALWIRGMPFSISAGIGFIALFGIAVLNGIVLLSTFRELESEGIRDVKERIVKACTLRLRPVLMTASVASLGFLPMALSHGAGAEVQRPLATVVIGGLISATFLTLIVLPILYSLFQKRNVSMKVNKKITGIIILFFILNHAQGQRDSVSLEQALKIATENSIETKNSAFRKNGLQIDEATHFGIGTGGLFIENEDLRPSDTRGILKMGITYTSPVIGKGRTAKELAGQKINELEIQTHLYQNQLRQEVRTSYIYCGYLMEKIYLLQNTDSLYGEMKRISSLKYKTGESPALEFMNASYKKEEILRQEDILLKEYKIALADFNLLLNHPDISYIPKNIFHENRDTEMDIEYNDLTGRLLSVQQQLNKKELELQKKELQPVFNTRLFSQHLYGVSNPYNGFSIGMQMPLLRNEFKNRQKKVQLENQRLDMVKSYQNKQVQKQKEVLELELLKNRETIDYYVRKAIPNTLEILKAAQLAYKGGEMTYIDYTQYQNEYILLRQNLLDARYNYLLNHTNYLNLLNR